MVGHLPLKEVILVRIQASQLCGKIIKEMGIALGFLLLPLMAFIMVCVAGSLKKIQLMNCRKIGL